MKPYNSIKYICTSAFVIMISCKSNNHNALVYSKDEKPLARVYSHYLYPADIEEVTPKGTNPSDSADIVTNYINNWISQKILLQKAEENLSEKDKDFSEQIRQYRNSLIVFAYESELLRQKLDTTILYSEIEKYYNENKDNFKLNDHIVQATYVVADNHNAHIPKLKRILQASPEDNIPEMVGIAQTNKFDFSVGKGKWMSFSDLIQKIPLQVQSPEAFLQKNKFFEISDANKTYLVALYKHLTKGAVSPLEFEADNIRTIILNKRKAEMIKKMQEDLFADAEKNNNFEIYKN